MANIGKFTQYVNRNSVSRPHSRYVMRTHRPSILPITIAVVSALFFFFSVSVTSIKWPFSLSIIEDNCANDVLFIVTQIKVLLISLAMTIISIVIADKINNYMQDKVSMRNFDSLNENLNSGVDEVLAALDRSFTCTIVGTAENGLEYVQSRLQNVSRIYDTMIVHGIPEELERVLYYREEKLAKFKEDMKACIEQGCIWLDVFSTKYKNRLSDIVQWSENNSCVQYKCYEIENNIPIINFLILEYKDQRINKNEVLFGWGHFDHYHLAPVFRSDEKHIVDLFYRQFTSLVEAGKPFTTSSPKAVPTAASSKP